MSHTSLDICLERHRKHAALCHAMDDQLGILHGVSWLDFVLLDTLESSGGVLPSAALAQKLSVLRSRLLLQLIPLEKIGLVTRSVDSDGVRYIFLRPNGHRQVREARETAARLCEDMGRMQTYANGGNRPEEDISHVGV
jgi:predicted transcriptional regulator